jgi:hypothetical protein
VDEAQNLTPHEVKTILTRAGEGTKIVLTGDPDQIDNPYVDAASNGLTYVVERFKGESLAGHITLTKGSDRAWRSAELGPNRALCRELPQLCVCLLASNPRHRPLAVQRVLPKRRPE